MTPRSYPITRWNGRWGARLGRSAAHRHVDPPRRFAGLPERTILGLTVPVATTRRSRLLGLALLDRQRAGPGLLIPGCRSVHTFGMRFALDLVFLDQERRVVELRRSVPPGRITRSHAAVSILELPSPRCLDQIEEAE
jgi:uncharacterized protein